MSQVEMNYILQARCTATEFSVVRAMTRLHGESRSQALRRIVREFGAMRGLIRDNGQQKGEVETDDDT